MTLTARQRVLMAAGGSAALLAGAFFFQFLGYAPCKMCLWQRWPHAAAVVIGLLYLASGRRLLIWAGAAAALVTGTIGLYHAGVERGIFEGPDTCTSNGVAGISTDELMSQILNAPLVRCDEIAWSLFGLSMAGWNALISFLLAAVWLSALRAGRR